MAFNFTGGYNDFERCIYYMSDRLATPFCDVEQPQDYIRMY